MATLGMSDCHGHVGSRHAKALEMISSHAGRQMTSHDLRFEFETTWRCWVRCTSWTLRRCRGVHVVGFRAVSNPQHTWQRALANDQLSRVSIYVGVPSLRELLRQL
eukprot:5389120-Amphidinium_carterae.3